LVAKQHGPEVQLSHAGRPGQTSRRLSLSEVMYGLYFPVAAN